MLVKKLKLTNVRAFTEAEFEFGTGVNLLVGVNGVGKSTVLNSLRFLLANAFNKLSPDKENLNFDDEDVSIGSEFLVGQMEGEIQDQEFEYLILHSTKKTASALGEINQQKFAGEEPRKARAKKDRESQIYNQTVQTGIKNDFLKIPTISKTDIKPIAVFFSPHRSIFIKKKSDSAAFNKKALSERQFNQQYLIDWLPALEATKKENPLAESRLQAIEKAVQTFLDYSRNLHVSKGEKPRLQIEKNGETLDVNWLSEGERGVLSLVLDLTVRLTTANPTLENPHLEGKAVVLIDELDLHLHPKWQREIVDRLEKTFPNCQFIATTHSPQIVGEVSPEKIYLLSNSEKPFQPDQSLGMDTNWILKYLMQTDEEDSETKEKLAEIENLIKAEKYETAQDKIDELRKLQKGDSTKLIRLQAINSIYL